MLTKANLEALADARAKEAQCLFDHECYPGSYYLAGYAVECALKACIAKQFQANAIPDKKFVLNIHTHDFDKLIQMAGLHTALEDAKNQIAGFAGAWGSVKEWDESSRYRQWDRLDALMMVSAVTDHKSGVLQWLKKHY